MIPSISPFHRRLGRRHRAIEIANDRKLGQFSLILGSFATALLLGS